jgi:D-alanyl-lipoteichoic acid acyltransferase DltB (MBOAT superfamily)
MYSLTCAIVAFLRMVVTWHFVSFGFTAFNSHLKTANFNVC